MHFIQNCRNRYSSNHCRPHFNVPTFTMTSWRTQTLLSLILQVRKRSPASPSSWWQMRTGPKFVRCSNDWIIIPQLMPLVCRVFKKVSVIYSLHGYYKSLVFLDLWQMSISFFFTMRSRGSNQWASTIQRHRVPPGESVQYLQDENWYFKTVTSTLFYLYCELSEQKL